MQAQRRESDAQPVAAALILFAHGARDLQWRGPVDALVARLRGALADTRVEPAFLELMSPALPEAIDSAVAAGSRRVVVAPVFWAPGGHLRNDLPLLIDAARRRHEGVSFEVWPPLGESDAVLAAITGAYVALWAGKEKAA